MATMTRKSVVANIKNTLDKSKQRRQLLNSVRHWNDLDPAMVKAQTMRHSTVVYSFFNLVEELVSSSQFDYTMGSLLAMNAIILGISVNNVAVNDLHETPSHFRVAETIFMTFFTCELILRLLAFREKFFKVEGWRWNLFDLIIISLGWFCDIGEAIFQNHPLVKNGNFVWMIKLSRLSRLTRMVRLIPELKSMVYLIFASMGSFLWTLVLMMLVVFCMAVYLTELASDMVQRGDIIEADLARVEIFWGSIPKSVLTLYMSITGGDDWRTVVNVFWKSDDEFIYVTTAISFVVFIAFTTLVMLNLVTGVFVEGAQRIIREDLDAELMNMAATVFIEADCDHSKSITADEWNEQLYMGHLDDYIRAVGVSRAEATQLFQLLDQDDSGEVTIVEFVRGCLRLRGAAKAMDVAGAFHHMKKAIRNIEEQLAEINGKVQSQAAGAHIQPLHDRSISPSEECLL